jgi:hypothetical protein
MENLILHAAFISQIHIVTEKADFLHFHSRAHLSETLHIYARIFTSASAKRYATQPEEEKCNYNISTIVSPEVSEM